MRDSRTAEHRQKSCRHLRPGTAGYFPSSTRIPRSEDMDAVTYRSAKVLKSRRMSFSRTPWALEQRCYMGKQIP